MPTQRILGADLGPSSSDLAFLLEHVRVINLDSRADRWAAMQAQFERLGVTGDIQRFAAAPAAGGGHRR